jgi:cell shape-determining protein MreC
MSSLRFNHVYTFLLLFSAASAFLIPPRFTNPLRTLAQGMFAPVARPTRILAANALGKFQDQPAPDDRPDKDIRVENDKLRSAVASLTRELDQLRAIHADYERLGDIAEYCTRVSVMGVSPGKRDSLSLKGSFSSSMVDYPVLYEQSVIGKIDRAGISGAQVRLITDRGVVNRGRFGRFVDNGMGGVMFLATETTDPIIEGAGNGVMLVRNIGLPEAKAAIHPGDWVVLDDSDWPAPLQNRRMGSVRAVRSRSDAPLFAEIVVEPSHNLLTLQDVMVMNKKPAGVEESASSNDKGSR